MKCIVNILYSTVSCGCEMFCNQGVTFNVFDSENGDFVSLWMHI